MAALSDTTKQDSIIESYCELKSQVEIAFTKFYDIENPPTVEEQFAMFPDRAEGDDNLVYMLMKMEDRTGHMPIVFCTDCAAEKYVQYCNTGVWEYLYKPCAVDKDFYCPKFYAELMRRIWTDHVNADVWKQLLPTVLVQRVHVDGCFHSSTPEFIIQRKEGLADSIYFRHCGGDFRNLMMQKLEMETEEDATTSGTGKWLGQHPICIQPHTVPGLEWKETTVVQSVHFADRIMHL